MMTVQILVDKCNTASCEQECIVVCPQNKKGKIAIEISKNKANIIRKTCINCLQCVYACPIDSIVATIGKKEKHERPLIRIYIFRCLPDQ